VALGRALVREPQLLLLDEPLSNRDAKLRVQTRAEISRLHHATGTTFVYVTHDQVEAMTMGDRIAVLNAGVVQQLGTPQDLYNAPANLFVAGFIGSPAMDFFEARLVAGAGGGAGVRIGTGADERALSLSGARASQVTGAGQADGRAVTVGIRPEDLRLAGPEEAETLRGTVEVVEHLGNEQLIYLRIPGALTSSETHGEMSIARVPTSARLRMGEAVALAVETSRLHLFDPVSGQRL
jgi:ABC-type sugar transport system ATPase subunit